MSMKSKKGLLLTVAIVLLIVLNGMQLYGIFSESPAKSDVKPKGETDTTHVPIQINV